MALAYNPLPIKAERARGTTLPPNGPGPVGDQIQVKEEAHLGTVESGDG